MEASFTVRTIADQETGLGAIIFVAATPQITRAYMSSFVDIAFPPGERSSSILSYRSTPTTHLLYDVSSTVGNFTIDLEHVGPDLGPFLRTSIEAAGQVVIIFGAENNDTVDLLDPLHNYICRTEVLIDGQLVHGVVSGDIKPMLGALSDGFETFSCQTEEE